MGSFALTINRVQRKTLKVAVKGLRFNCLSTISSLYVAYTRFSSPTRLLILKPGDKIANSVHKKLQCQKNRVGQLSKSEDDQGDVTRYLMTLDWALG